MAAPVLRKIDYGAGRPSPAPFHPGLQAPALYGPDLRLREIRRLPEICGNFLWRDGVLSRKIQGFQTAAIGGLGRYGKLAKPLKENVNFAPA